MPPSPTVRVRPPWVDERPHLKTFLPGLNPRGSEQVHLFVLEADKPERLAGAVALVPHENKQGRLFIKVRPRFVENGSANLLFFKILERARELNLEQISAEVSTGDVLTTNAFPEGGFEQRKTEELWRLELPRFQQRLDRLSRARPLPETWIARAPTEADLPALGKMAEHYRFRQTGDIRLDGPGDRPGTHYSAELSSVIEADGKLVAALMAKASAGLNCHTDLRMTAPEASSRSAKLNLALLARSLSLGLAAGYATTTLTVNIARDRETRQFAERSGGQLINSKELWVRTIR